MLNRKKIFLFFVGLFMTGFLFAQDGDIMRSNGKIYVVMVVVLTILIGLFLYIWRVEKKIAKLEKENK